MHDLAEIIEKSKDVKELKEKLLDCLKGEMSSKGAAGMDTKEAGEVVDMIKDLAETEKLCMEALYFQKVVEAMTSYDEPRYGEPMGYSFVNARATCQRRWTCLGMEHTGTPEPDQTMVIWAVGLTAGTAPQAMEGPDTSCLMVV